MILGIGTDICEVSRFKNVELERWKGRIFSEREWEYCMKYKDYLPHFAGFWAAKESVVKALSKKDLTLSEVEVLHDPNGKPIISFIPERGVLHLSISHEKEYATAFVIWEEL